MAANARNRQIALQAAEAVLRDAEVSLFAARGRRRSTRSRPRASPMRCTDGLLRAPRAGQHAALEDRRLDVDDGDAHIRVGHVEPSASLVASQPRYIVESRTRRSSAGRRGICPQRRLPDHGTGCRPGCVGSLRPEHRTSPSRPNAEGTERTGADDHECARHKRSARRAFPGGDRRRHRLGRRRSGRFRSQRRRPSATSGSRRFEHIALHRPDAASTQTRLYAIDYDARTGPATCIRTRFPRPARSSRPMTGRAAPRPDDVQNSDDRAARSSPRRRRHQRPVPVGQPLGRPEASARRRQR